MRSVKFLLALLASVSFLVGPLVPAHAAPRVDSTYVEGTDPQAFLFNPLVVNRFDLTMTTADRTALANDTRNYHPARLVVTTQKGTTKSLQVGVRLKGQWGSARTLDEKAAFKIKMNFSVKGQSLYGIQKFTLNNMVQDASMIHEAVGYRLSRAMGVPSPRVGYANVTLNGANYGLHLNVETYDNQMFKRWMPGKTAHLYEGAYGTEVGPNLEVDDGSMTDKADVIELENLNNTLTGADWYVAIRSKVDIQEMVMDWAVEHYIGHWDGYTRNWPNNYYLHRTVGGLFTMHLSGIDQTWVTWNELLDNGATMMTRCIQYQPCQELYQEALGKIQATLPKLGLPHMVDRVWQAILPDLTSDPRKPYDLAAATAAKNSTIGFMNNRVMELWQYDAGRKLAKLGVSYSIAGAAVDGLLQPRLTKNSDGLVNFLRIQGDQVCDVNSATGMVTIHHRGLCEIEVETSRTTAFQAAMVTTKIMVPALPGRVAFTNLVNIQKGQSLLLDVTKDSSKPATLTVLSGGCSVSGLRITAKASSGICRLRVSVAGDTDFTSVSKVLNVRLGL